MGLPGHHPAIVDQVVFDAVRERIGQKSKPRRKQKAKARQRHSSAEHALKGRGIQALIRPGNHLSPHPEQREQAKQMEDAKRALYERFILGEICADAFKAENAILGESLKASL